MAFFWSLPFLVALLPIVLLSVYSYRIAADSVQNLVQSSNLSAVSNFSQQMNQDLFQVFTVTTAFSSLPGTVDAASNLDAKAMRVRLKPLVLSSPAVNRAFMTTSGGVLWSDYPPAVDTVGENFFTAQWFKDVLKEGRSVISNVYVRTEDPPAVVTAIASPVFADEHMIGVLVLEYSLSALSEQLRNIRLAESGYLYVLDSSGTLVAHPENDQSHLLYAGYNHVESIREALAGTMRTTEYTDPLLGKSMLATFLPVNVGGKLWVIVANQPVDEAYAPLWRVRVRIALAGSFLTLLTLSIIVSLARTRARNERLNRELRKLASIVEQSNDAIIGLTADARVRTWNAAATRLLGYSVQDVLSKPFVLFSPKEKLTLVDLLGRVARGEAVEHLESVWVKKNGDMLPVSLTISAVRNAEKRMIGGSVIAQDISERKRIETLKDNVISFVSHQLKAPVAAIRWHSELLLEAAIEEKFSEESRSLVQEIYDVNAQNHVLISDLLNVSRIQRGVIEVKIKPVFLKDVVEMSVKNYRQPITQKGLKLIIEDIDPTLRILADTEKITEAVGNSVSNGLKHTENGAITVRIEVKSNQVCIHVSDTGEGMDEATLRKLFTQDQLLTRSAGDGEVSAGLGLYIAKNFMTLQGGDITVQSQVGVGTTFTYWIPLANVSVES